jgi:hypothetical protein
VEGVGPESAVLLGGQSCGKKQKRDCALHGTHPI